MRTFLASCLLLTVSASVGCRLTDGDAPPADPFDGRTILASTDLPWEALDDGWRRKVLFSGELTFVLLEAPGPTEGDIPLHHHVHDQISHVLEGEIDVQIGEQVQRIATGGFFRVPSNAPHGIRIISPSMRLVDVFTPPREDFRG